MDDQQANYKENIKNKIKAGFEKEKKSWLGFFIRKYRFTYLIIISIVVFGFFSLFTLPKEAEPEIKVPYAVITTIYPGASPSDIEELITDEIEPEIESLDDLNKYQSSSRQGVSSIFVEFYAEADLKESFRKLREAVDEAEPRLPDGAESPIVTEINFNDFPIVTYSLVGDYSDIELKKFGDIIQDEFEKIKDVSKVEILGGLEREFQIIVDQTKLANFNISLGQIVSTIQINNFSLPAGNIEIDGFKYNVGVSGRFAGIEELEEIVIATYEDAPIFLKDVALIKDDFKEKNTESKIGFKGETSKNTLSMQTFKKTGGNILNIADNSQKALDEMFDKNILPENLRVIKTNDNSVFIKDDLNTLGTSGLQTMILIAIILMLVLSFRGAIITALAVPIAFLMAFVFLKIQGMTLNSMVLFSLVLSLGLMVDNAIVVIEGINEYVEKHGKSILEAAILSVWNFKWAITAGTMTTVAAFAPMLLVSGILGEYLSILPKTISVTLLSSLFVALVAIPTLAARFIKITNGEKRSHRNKRRHNVVGNIMKKIQARYIPFLRDVLPNKKKRRRAIGLSFLLFIIAIAVPISGLMKVEMFSKIDLDYFVVNIEMPVGTILDDTKPVTKKVGKIISEIPELDNYVTNIGSSANLGYDGGGASGSHLASITVNLGENRKKKSFEVAEEIRPKLEEIKEAEVTVEELSAGPPTGAPIEVRIFGEDIKKLSTLSGDVIDYFESVPGVINIKDNIDTAAGEFTFSVDRQKMNYYGLDLVTIASTLRSAIHGTEASEISIDGEDVDITVKYNDDEFTSVNDLENILLFTPRGESILLKQITTIELNPSLLAINHRGGEKVVVVTADTEEGINLQNIIKDFEEFKSNMIIPDGYSIDLGGEVEDIEKSFQETFYSMIVAVILIAMILVLQFNSFRQPFIIIFSLPLALIGVIIGLNITGQAFSFPAFIGIVSLSGIVVNDAIVLIDRINKNIYNGMEFVEAIIDGGISRMQPIFLTSITTIAGIAPLIYANELWRGLSITVIFGLIFSTVLTLVIIPIMFASICQKKFNK